VRRGRARGLHGHGARRDSGGTFWGGETVTLFSAISFPVIDGYYPL
jgi:hypothetical protein